jgi:release factor glutamine methyltransferase
VDLCTGSGALAAALARARPGARVIGTDLDAAACRCARANGIEAVEGHLAEPLPAEIWGRCDVVTAVPPYVPTADLVYLPRDVRDWEPRLALDGGADGLDVVRQLVPAAAGLLHPGGVLLIEIGGGQDATVGRLLSQAGFRSVELVVDEDGDLRGVQAVRAKSSVTNP